MSNQSGLTWHEDRSWLYDELHSRPFQRISGDVSITHIAVLADQKERQVQSKQIQKLLKMLGIESDSVDQACNIYESKDLRIRWEQHMEFTSLTITDSREGVASTKPFFTTALDRLPDGWLSSYPGKTVAAFHMRIQNMTSDEIPSPAEVKVQLDNMQMIGSLPQNGAAQIWTTFRTHSDSFGRFLIFNKSMSKGQMGRMVQRVIEVETYRLLALLGLKEARLLSPIVADMDSRMADLTRRLSTGEKSNDTELLGELINLSADIEAERARTTFRFNASRSYHDVMAARLDELREDEVSGHLTLKEFLIRRLTPAVRGCETMHNRLDDLSRRVNRASDMMRTRVEMAIQNQNQQLLSSMDRRSRIQLAMQHTVEGLSVAAISYYAVGLVKYLIDAAVTAGAPIDKEIATGVSVPVVIGAVWFITRKIHSRFKKLAEAKAEEVN
jgi:uncharacterized membrane-anchored protein